MQTLRVIPHRSISSGIPVNGFEGVRLFCYYGYYSKFGLMDKTKGSD
ncbi:hypothetical protein NST07_27895 [Paenibacillus sp. FSL L8-0340]